MPYIDIQSGQRKLYYVQHSAASESSRPTLLFIHGLGCSSSVWLPIIPSIVAAGYACVALDNHGHGLSPYAGISGHEQSTQDIMEAMEVLGLSPANTVLVGHSLGSLFVSAVATRCSLAGAVFMSPWRPNESDTAKYSAAFEASIKIMQTEGSKGLEGHLYFMLATSVGPKASDLVRAFISTMTLATPIDGMIGGYQTCLDIRVEDAPDYAQISCPFLAIGGKADKESTLQLCTEFVENTSTDKSKKELKLIADINHWPMLEAPEITTQHILDFLITLP